MSPTELINIVAIQKEKIVPYGYKTISRYFQRGIFYIHDKNKNVERLTYRGSAQVRAQIMQKIKTGRRSMSLEDIGRLFDKVSGEDDEFIVSRLKEKKPIDEICSDFMEKIKKED